MMKKQDIKNEYIGIISIIIIVILAVAGIYYYYSSQSPNETNVQNVPLESPEPPNE